MRYFTSDQQKPQRATTGSAGYDIRILEGGTIDPHETKVFKTGLKVHMAPDEVLLIFIRSSIGIKRHLMLSNGTGVIDMDFKDDISIALTNYGDTPVTLEDNERVAQGVFVSYLTVTNDVTQKERKGGIGSTGRFS